jgi:hypothetical protein
MKINGTEKKQRLFPLSLHTSRASEVMIFTLFFTLQRSSSISYRSCRPPHLFDSVGYETPPPVILVVDDGLERSGYVPAVSDLVRL